MGSRRKQRCTVASCWRTFKAALTLSTVALGVACMVLMPDYRYYAAFLVGQAVVVYFQLWRFTPCDRSRVQRLVQKRVDEAVDRVDRRWRRKRSRKHNTKASSHRSATPESDTSDNSGSDNDAPDSTPANRKKGKTGRPKQKQPHVLPMLQHPTVVGTDAGVAFGVVDGTMATPPRGNNYPARHHLLRVDGGNSSNAVVGYNEHEPFLEEHVFYAGGGDGSMSVHANNWAAAAMTSPATATQRRQHNLTPLLVDQLTPARRLVGSRGGTPVQYSPLMWTPSPVRRQPHAASGNSHSTTSRSPGRIVVRATDYNSSCDDDDNDVPSHNCQARRSPHDEFQTPTRRLHRSTVSSTG